MGNYFRLTVHLPHKSTRRPQRRARSAFYVGSAGKLVLGQKTIALTLMGMILFLGGLYVMFINIRVTKGYEIKSLESRLAELQKDQKQLELQTADLQSMQRIEQNVDMSRFIPSQDVSYVKDQGFALTSP